MSRRCEHLLDRLRTLWGEGLRLDSAAMDFLEDALPERSAAALGRVLAEPFGAEAATVCEWLFSPSPAFQQRIEPLLTDGHFDAADVEWVMDRLRRRPPRVRLVFQRWSEELTAVIPPDAAASCVRALRLDRRLPPDLLAGLGRFPDPDFRLSVRVLVRNRPREISGESAEFLRNFLRSVPVEEPEIAACVELICQLTEERNSAADMASALADRKRHHFRSLKVAEHHARKRERHNMETLMMTGERASHVDPEEARRCMRRIDVICRACSGETVHFEDAAAFQATVDAGDLLL